MRNFMRIVLTLIIVGMVSSLPAHADRGRHGHGGGRVGVSVFLGPGWFVPGWWGPYPYYPYYAPPVIVEQPSDIYVQPAPSAEAPRYWYYCKDPEGYYPNIKSCPKGWMKVVPPAQPPAGEE
jgi:hypothetical protein